MYDLEDMFRKMHTLCIDFYDGFQKFRVRFIYLLDKGGYDLIEEYRYYFQKVMRILDNIERNIEFWSDAFLRNEVDYDGEGESLWNIDFSDISTIPQLSKAARSELFVLTLYVIWEFRKDLEKLRSQKILSSKVYRVDMNAALAFISEAERDIIKLINILGKIEKL